MAAHPGKTLLEAFDRLELIETAAQTTLLARQLDGFNPSRGTSWMVWTGWWPE